jgi:hypothetical protein
MDDNNSRSLDKKEFNKAKEFSIETIYSPKSFGVHAPWKHLKAEEQEQLKKDCPGLETLMSLQ